MRDGGVLRVTVQSVNRRRMYYFSLFATIARPPNAHFSSAVPVNTPKSLPGGGSADPLTPTPPMTSLPALIGTPPGSATVPWTVNDGGGNDAQYLACSPEVLWYVNAVYALR